MRLLVTGSREWTDQARLEQILGDAVLELVSRLPRGSQERVTVVHGDCPNGADRFAATFCRLAGLLVEPHPADWDRGRHAGFLRNEEMVELGADLCLAFLTPGCKGTVHCAAYAQSHGIPVVAYFQAPPLRRRRT